MRTTRLLAMLAMIILSATATQGESVPQLMNVQGMLTDDTGEPVADDGHSVLFTLYDAAGGGTVLWSETRTVTTVGGLFTIILGESTPLPASLFETVDLWLGITVETDPEMVPRQRLTSVPFAMKAEGMGSSYWYVADSVLYTNGEYGLARGGVSNGVLGMFPETMVNLGVQCTTGVEPGGDWYATVSGGLYNKARSSFSTIGGGGDNITEDGASTVSGGTNNKAIGYMSTVGGGGSNKADGHGAVIAGGLTNTASGPQSFVGAGDHNYATGGYSVVAGGKDNHANGLYSAILGGYSNSIAESAEYSYLFGINGYLIADSTFMVDMPHIHFGKAAFGYEFPSQDGSAGQTMVTDGDGQLSWSAPATGGGWVDDGNSVRLATASDKVGIGTSTPGVMLDVIGNARFHGYSPPTTGKGLELAYDYFTRNGMVFAYDHDFGEYCDLFLGGNVGIGQLSPKNRLDVDGSAVIGTAYAGVKTAPANGLLVEGKVGIGTNDPQDVLEVKGFVRFDGGAGNGSALRFAEDGTLKWALLYRPWADDKIGFWDEINSSWALALEPATGEVGIGTDSPNYTLDVRGTIGNNTTLYHSDRRWKKDVTTINDALDKACRLRGVQFNWRQDEFAEMNFPEGRHLGVIAQEVEEVMPEVVHTSADGYKSVEYANLVAVLIEAVKELKADNSTLRERIERLETEK